MNKKLIEDALRKARKYIRTTEAFIEINQDEQVWKLNDTLNDWIDGDEVETIEKALAELGIIV